MFNSDQCDHAIRFSDANPYNFPFVLIKNITVPIALFNNQYFFPAQYRVC